MRILGILFLVFDLSCNNSAYLNGIRDDRAKEYFDKAQRFQKEGNVKNAILFFNKADSILLNTPVILHERGLLKSNIGNYTEGLKDLNLSIKLTLDSNEKKVRCCNRGLVHYDFKNLTSACNDWRHSGEYGKRYLLKYCSD